MTRRLLDPFFFFFNDTATTEIYTLSLHDALPICEREALRDRRRAHMHGGNRAEHLPDDRRAGKEGGGVPVHTHAEEHEVEARELAAPRAERGAERARVLRRGDLEILGLAADPEDLRRGDRHLAEERLVGHPVVGVRVVGWDGALVAEEDPHAAPVHALAERREREPRVRRPRCLAAPPRPHEAPPRPARGRGGPRAQTGGGGPARAGGGDDRHGGGRGPAPAPTPPPPP